MKIDHTVVTTTSMSASPKKTMPYAEINGKLVSDSRLIIGMLDAKLPSPIDHHLTPEQRSMSTAYSAMIENQLFQILAYFRWQDEKGWKQFAPIIFAGAPALVRIVIGGFMRRGELKSLHSHGMGRHSEDEICQFAKEDIESIALLLGQKSFVFGERLSLLDLVVYSITSNIMYGKVEMPLIGMIQSHPNLVAHIDRVSQQVFQKNFH
jgi:glutathione S-transferase